MEINLKNRNVLVTGGTGFVGSHLVKELVKIGANVVTTFEYIDPKSYFITEKLDKKCTMVKVDVADFDDVFDIVTKFDIEFIFHLAAQALVEVAFYNPRRTLESNIMGTVNILESARLYPKIKAVVVASSDKAYGKLASGKYVETDPLRGDHPYDVSKSATDLISLSYFTTYNTPVTVSRFGNLYGEGDMNFSRIIPILMNIVANKQILELRSDGQAIRDYLYVKDVVDGYIKLVINIDKTVGQAFNFGSADTLSVLKLINLVGKGLKKKVKYKILNTAKNEIPYQSLDDTKSRKILSWKSKTNIIKSIRKIYNWYSK
ncbi:MAG: GDP-mannose 4,6-dehydratase [bacterium]|nr:GDP-mannose 4,6-dehydratase [bacterium]